MRNVLFPAAAAALIVSSFAAVAATDTMTSGAVKSFDLAKHVLVLDNGISYALPATFKDPGLKVGGKVTVGWMMKGNVHQADKVSITK